jgi:hypothetical protein
MLLHYRGSPASSSSVVYLRVGDKGFRLLESSNPKIVIRFPKKEEIEASAASSVETKASKARKSVAQEDGWLTAKPKATKRKAAATKKGKKAAPRKKSQPVTKAKKTTRATKKRSAGSDVIELSSDDDADDHAPIARLKTAHESGDDALWQDDDSESDCEFE